ncbi:SHOCT domain-containing protein [Jiangella rhizosphaerae]|uniref:SHOCT domain-containing protein n=1 Tax=Jiangella rhizosphaerae TaxID=2293569 RepID=A0A418KKT5_9ACTN|nr:SHOCT domain-containing protein [Jiangella rhizosphaerae]RIQ18221.1 SHOCT domain-containing protein [Jiangella rhizosphaerae]
MFWYSDHMSGWGYVLMTFSMVIFWGLVIAGVVALVRYPDRSGDTGRGQGTTPAAPRPAPEEILAERFARGEIDEEEYARRRAALHAAHPS